MSLLKTVKIFFLIITISTLAYNCSSNHEKTDAKESDSTVNFSNYQVFIDHIINKRLTEEKSPGFEISGKLVYISKDSNSYIVTFMEGYDEWLKNRSYTIALNINGVGADEINDNFEEYGDIFKMEKLFYFFLRGELQTLPYDINQDGKNDFLLVNEVLHSKSVIKYQRVILTEPEDNAILYTQIFAETHYELNDQLENGKTGKVEEITFSEKKGVVTISLKHESDETHPEYDFRYHTEYHLNWQWHPKNNHWKFGIVIPGRHNMHYANLKGEYARLWKNEDGYFLMEDCMEGGIAGFSVREVKNSLSDFNNFYDGIDYVVLSSTHIEHIGYVLKVVEVPYEWQNLSIIENKFGKIELNKTYNWVLAKDTKIEDDEMFTLSHYLPDIFYTLNPKKYYLQTCN